MEYSMLYKILIVCLVKASLADYQLEVDADYNLHERPVPEKGGPIHINASINIRNILDIDEKAQLVSLETTLRFYWKDERIKPKEEYLESEDFIGQYTTLNPSLAEKIWMPDIFIDQAKTLRMPTYFTRPASIRVYNNSLIRYSSRINFDVACNMDFHWYPVDQQFCLIKFESFGLQSKQMKLSWLPGPHGLTVNNNITLAQFNCSVELMNEYATDYYETNYPGLMIQLHLTRQLGYHIVQTYIPSSVFVVLGWLSLFIPAESVPGRVGMVMTTMLTLTAMFSSVRHNVPRISYCSVLDVWMLTCIIFVFGTMLEFITVTILNRDGKKRQAERFERICLIAFPILFIVVSFTYWTVILSE